MKLKDYFNSLVSRRKNTASSKSQKPNSHHESISSTDCHYEVCGPNDNKVLMNDNYNRTQFLLTRHAHLVNRIVGTHSQENSCSHCRGLHQSEQQNLFANCNYSNTLGTCSSPRDCQYQTLVSSSNNSLWTKTRQRSKIRTNPWIKNTQTSSPSHFKLSSGLIHSESFPQTISNGNIRSTNPLNRILHQSDSGHGFSLSSSRIVDSSSTDNASHDGLLLNKKQHNLYTKHIEQYSPPKTIPSDNKRKGKQSRYQRSSNTHISSPTKAYINRKNHSRSSSPRIHNDHFSLEFEEILENEHSHKQQKSQFILPLDETDVQSSSPLPILYSTLKRSNSRTILKHIEEIENEIQMIKNLNLDRDEQILLSNVYPKQNDRQSIHEQIDHWIEQCLTTTKDNSTTLLHNECDHLSNTIKDYVTCVCSDDKPEISSLPKSQTSTELMTAFYLSSTPSTKRTSSFIDQPIQLFNSQTITKDLKPTHECPF